MKTLPVMPSVSWTFDPTNTDENAQLSFRAKIDMSLGSPLCMKMREALWSAVACYRFRSGQLAGRGRVYRAFGERGRERARGTKAAASCRTPQRLRRLTCHSEEVAGRPTNNLLSTVRNRKSR